jgi:hypothetical protein
MCSAQQYSGVVRPPATEGTFLVKFFGQKYHFRGKNSHFWRFLVKKYHFLVKKLEKMAFFQNFSRLLKHKGALGNFFSFFKNGEHMPLLWLSTATLWIHVPDFINFQIILASNGACPVNEWSADFMGKPANFKMTSVCGHVMTLVSKGIFKKLETKNFSFTL